MGWYLTPDLDKFLVATKGYLSTRAAENITLLQAAQAAADGGHDRGAGSLYGWWAPPGGAEPLGAFMHPRSGPLLIAGRAPESAAALAAPLAKASRPVSGVDAGVVAADAFADAWRQRAGVVVRVHHSSQVYRLAGAVREYEGPAGRARSATWADRELLVDWLRAYGNEIGVLAGIPESSADDMLGYGGAVLWEADGRPVAMATMTRVVADVVQVINVYSPPEHRGRGYAVAVMVAVSRAALVGRAREVVIIADRVRPLRSVLRLGFEVISERAVLSFGPPARPVPGQTGPMPRVPTGPLPRMPTGPLPRIR